MTQDPVASVNHEFLVNKKVIPKDFKKKDNSFNTPVVSQIHYNNGFSITGEPNKTSFQFLNPNADELSHLNNLNILKNISSQYVGLFNVKYHAVGINFDFIRDELQYQSFVEKIIKMDSDHLNFENNKGEVQSIALSYNVKGKQFNITVSKVEKKQNNAQFSSAIKSFIPLFKINIHYQSDYTDNIVTIIEELEENYKKSKQFIESF